MQKICRDRLAIYEYTESGIFDGALALLCGLVLLFFRFFAHTLRFIITLEFEVLLHTVNIYHKLDSKSTWLRIPTFYSTWLAWGLAEFSRRILRIFYSACGVDGAL